MMGAVNPANLKQAGKLRKGADRTAKIVCPKPQSISSHRVTVVFATTVVCCESFFSKRLFSVMYQIDSPKRISPLGLPLYLTSQRAVIFLWGHPKSIFYQERLPHTVVELKMRIRLEVERIPTRVLAP